MAEHVGLFIPLPERLARQYPPDGKEGEDSSPPHLTLVYIGDVPDDRIDELRAVLTRIVQAIPPLELKLQPPTTFKNDEGQTILHSPVSGPLLERAHNAIDGALKRRGFDVQGYDEFKPHVTIEYVDPGAQPKFSYVEPKGQWVADSVGFWVGEDRRSLPFGSRKTVNAAAVPFHTVMTKRGRTWQFVHDNGMVVGTISGKRRALAFKAALEASGLTDWREMARFYMDWREKNPRQTRASLMNPGVDDAAIIVSQKYAGAYGRFLSRGGIGKLPALSRILAAEHKRWQQTQKVGTPFTLDELTREYIELQTPAIERAYDREGAAMSVGLTTLTKQPYRSMVERLIGKAIAKRAVIACMLQADRPDLANVVAYGSRTPEDLLHSINTLAKYNDGLWKSEKQGNFLLDWATKSDFLRGQKEAVAWARQTGWYDPQDKKQVVLQFITLIKGKGYGTRDPSKARYSGTFALLDGTGVLATASFKVQHPKKDEDASSFTPVPGTAKTRFVRDRKVVPNMNVDPAGDEARRIAEQLKANEPVIKAIESIPDWQGQRIFVDFHNILMGGGTLSPNMMRVVERNVPLPVMNVGNADDVAKKMEACDRWIEKLLPFIMDWLDEIEKERTEQQRYGRTEQKDWRAEVKQNWAQYRAGTYADPVQTTHPYMLHPFDLVSRFFDDVLKFNFIRYFKGTRGVNWQVGYWTLRPYVDKAVPKLKRGKPPTKTEVVVIRTMLALYDKLSKTSPDAFKRWLEKH